MKKSISLIAAAAAAALVADAGAAVAADPSVALTGEVEAVCSLPDVWTSVSQTGGASASEFSGKTWNIPPAAFADGGMGSVGDEYSIRIRGNGFCNTSHTILLATFSGGLASDPPGSAPPPGFANKRPMRYEAQWSSAPVGSAGAGAFGPQVVLSATSAGQTSFANYLVSGSLAPPGNRAFDILMALPRPAMAMPLVAGNYKDTIVVSVSPTP
jgi:hypothetical protein